MYRSLEDEGPVPVDLRSWPMLVLAVEERELPHARAYADAVGGEEVDLAADPWLADDLAGGFLVEGAGRSMRWARRRRPRRPLAAQASLRARL